MYAFLTGPMLWLSLLIFVIGLAWRVVRYIKGLDWKLERVAYGPGMNIGLKGAVTSALQWLVPFATHSWRKQTYFTIAFFFFHLGLVIVPLFLAGHAVILQERFGISWPTLPMCVADVFTVAGIIGGVMMFLRRLALPEVRFLRLVRAVPLALHPDGRLPCAARRAGLRKLAALAHLRRGTYSYSGAVHQAVAHRALLHVARAARDGLRDQARRRHTRTGLPLVIGSVVKGKGPATARQQTVRPGGLTPPQARRQQTRQGLPSSRGGRPASFAPEESHA